jgi:hypothetical protein
MLEVEEQIMYMTNPDDGDGDADTPQLPLNLLGMSCKFSIHGLSELYLSSIGLLYDLPPLPLS